jgi:hypothetical protein
MLVSSSAHSPNAALTGTRPPTMSMTLWITFASARPRAPRVGSLTSISPAPPSKAARASAAERTLTSKSVMQMF